MVIINYVRLDLILTDKRVEESIPCDFASRGKLTFRPSTSSPHSKYWGATNYWTQIYHQISPAKKKKAINDLSTYDHLEKQKGSC